MRSHAKALYTKYQICSMLYVPQQVGAAAMALPGRRLGGSGMGSEAGSGQRELARRLANAEAQAASFASENQRLAAAADAARRRRTWAEEDYRGGRPDQGLRPAQPGPSLESKLGCKGPIIREKTRLSRLRPIEVELLYPMPSSTHVAALSVGRCSHRKL